MNKTIFITGGNAGIGLATAIKFAENGCNVAIMSRRSEENENAKTQVEAAGGKGLVITGDVTVESDLSRAIEETVKTFGRLDYAFNNAGVEEVPTSAIEQTDDEYQKIMDVNVKGVWLCMKYQIPKMLEAGGGAIVNTSSVAGLIGMAQVPVYVAAKHAVIGMTKSVALEYAQQGIRVNAVCPAAVHTDLYERFTGGNQDMEEMLEGMHPMGRSGKPEEVAAGVWYLCNDATWSTGQGLVMDGGFTVP